MACYDKEIYYYTHASAEELEEKLSESTSKEKLVESLRAARDQLISDPSPFLPQEPFALVHGDFRGRNVMVHNGHINAVIDWAFAGSYPLSELLGGVEVEFFELEDDNVLEYGQWSDRIREALVEKVRGRGWDEDQVALMVGPGNRQLQLARIERIPADEEDDGHEDDGGKDDGVEDDGSEGDGGADDRGKSKSDKEIGGP